jgi:hypothetical protein
MKAYLGLIPPLLLILALAGPQADAQEQDKSVKKKLEWSWEQDKAKDRSKELGAALKKEVKKLQALLDLGDMQEEVADLIELSKAESKAVRGMLEDFCDGWIRKDGRGITIDNSDINDRFDEIAEEAEDVLGEKKADVFIDWLKVRFDAAESQVERVEATAEKLTKGLGKWAEEYSKEFTVKTKEIEKWAEDFGKEWEKWGEQLGEDFGKKWEKWGERFGRDMEKWGEQLGKDLEKWGEQYGKDWEKWGRQFGRDWEDFGKDWEKWGRQFGRDWEKWGKDLGRKLEGFEGKTVEDIADLADILG